MARRTDAQSEIGRLDEDGRRERNWKRWGPYLSERQWGTVREDYSPGGTAWDYFPHDHARSRVYRWGEDGLLGICDRECRLCFALGLWNGRDPILKERLFGLANPEGNHGEDVKEAYWYLEATPTHSYMKALYRYPQAEFPYARLVEENRRRGKGEREFEITDTGVFDGDRFFDVQAEYAKGGPDDLLIRISVTNRGADAATLHLLPTLWFRNTWAWGRTGEGYWPEPRITGENDGSLLAEHASLGRFRLHGERVREGAPQWLFTGNETNARRLFGVESARPHVKDAFHEYLIHGRAGAVSPEAIGTKAAALYRLELPPGETRVVRLRLHAEAEGVTDPLGGKFEAIFAAREREAEVFYAEITPPAATAEERIVARRGYAALLWSKQFYHYVVKHWLEGDPAQPAPPPERWNGRNHEWTLLYNRDVISMPDKWEYPWYAAWDLAFHMIPLARIDPQFAKEQLVLFLREWYMHPNGQIPAYEWAFSDANPPVHAWACWRVYKVTAPPGKRDRLFLSRVFQKLLINFTWWVNREDAEGRNLFSGGFLGMDNVGVFDRSRALPTGGHLEQADGTAWMAFYASTMMGIALELSLENPATEDLASKFFEHFIAIADAINTLGGRGLWDEEDGFYYDQLHVQGDETPLKVRSMVGLLPLIACEVLEQDTIDRFPGFARRMEWFLENRPDLARQIAYMWPSGHKDHPKRLLAIPSRDRLVRVLRYMLDESEFLSPYGIRSLSRIHKDHPYLFRAGGEEFRVGYVPGEGDTALFGSNSNWRGPIWFPVNYLLVEALERYQYFYGDTLEVECPTGSGKLMNLGEVAREIAGRLARIFLTGPDGVRPFHGGTAVLADQPAWPDQIEFNEYFDGDTGRGLGARFQGWTSLAVRFVEDLAKARTAARR